MLVGLWSTCQIWWEVAISTRRRNSFKLWSWRSEWTVMAVNSRSRMPFLHSVVCIKKFPFFFNFYCCFLYLNLLVHFKREIANKMWRVWRGEICGDQQEAAEGDSYRICWSKQGAEEGKVHREEGGDMAVCSLQLSVAALHCSGLWQEGTTGLCQKCGAHCHYCFCYQIWRPLHQHVQWWQPKCMLYHVILVQQVHVLYNSVFLLLNFCHQLNNSGNDIDYCVVQSFYEEERVNLGWLIGIFGVVSC